MVTLELVAKAIDEYAGAAGDPAVLPLGGVMVPLYLLQDLRRALKAQVVSK